MSLSVREDDGDLVHSLARETSLGTVTSIAPHARSKPQLCWSVVAKADCLRLAEILDEYPLRGRKSYVYALWRAALRWWVDGDPTKYQRNRDWAPMHYLKARITAECEFDPSRPPYSCHESDSRSGSDWNDYISGLLTADGSLSIQRNGKGFSPVVHIMLRVDDEPLLREIRRRLAVGRIYVSEPRRTTPTVSWMVRDSIGLLAMVEHLDGHPPRGRKAREYGRWRDGVLAHTSNEPFLQRREKLSRIRGELKRIRRFQPTDQG